MIALIRQLHIYAGLLTFAHFIIYGIAGLVGTFDGPPPRPKIPVSAREVPFMVPPSATDRQIADLVYARMQFPLSRPMPDFAIRRTPEHRLLLDFYNINGIRRVTVLESEGRLHIEEVHNNGWHFLGDIHAATPNDTKAPRLVRMWAWWNELAMWSLLGFCLSGAWLWLSTRPRYVWAWVLLLGAASALALLWRAFRV